MDQHNAWDFENAIQANFVQTEVGKFQTEVKKSFGWTEKKIVSCIYIRPSNLILDEPTNHDLEMIEWQSYFAKENITLFMVTHDRFLRTCVMKSSNWTTENYTNTKEITPII
jgi:ATP-binding cassette subfamily F protein uup